MSENSFNSKEPYSVSTTKKVFDYYFQAIGKRDFRQFYYDWHIDAMVEPFAELVEYFNEKYPKNSSEMFRNFVKDFTNSVDVYNIDCEKFCSVKSNITNKDKQLSDIIDKIETFSFELRQFIYSFANVDDYVKEFGGWVYKPNYPYSHLHGLSVSVDILNNLSQNFEALKDGNTLEKSRFLVDNYLRENIAPTYKYNENYSYKQRKALVKNLVKLRNQMDVEYSSSALDNYQDLFQIENFEAPKFGSYRPNGFELEFYVPKEYENYEDLIEYLKEKHDWKKVYTSNSNPDVYSDSQSVGVIMRDESLAAMHGLAPVEYASRIMNSKEDEKECLKIMDSFDKGYANVHCSLHQHVSTEGFDLDTYKRLVKRMMQHEDVVVSNFAAPERQQNKLLYATYISRNLSSNAKRDYPFLCVMADMCQNLDELRDMVGYGRKYKTLNIMPSKTIEFRYMNANFNQKFVEAFLEFNRDFVNSAVNNSGTHINRPLLNKYNWMQSMKDDSKTVLRHLSYYYQNEYDQFRPENKVNPHVIYEENAYARHVADAMSHTQKFGYYNSWYLRKMKNARAM